MPEEIAPFTTGGVYFNDGGEEHLSFTLGAGHGGSHPHLVHQFVELLRGSAEGYPNQRRFLSREYPQLRNRGWIVHVFLQTRLRSQIRCGT